MTKKVTYYTVAEVADRWGITAHQVREHIRARRLGAMKLNPDSVRPTYRVSEHHLAKFERDNNRSAVA
jgi:predicted transcriptional regulator